MPDIEQKPICDWCFDYLSGSCTEEQRTAFERHLPDCSGCREELEQLRVVWEALPEHMEPMQPPPDLKQQVMDAVLAVPYESGTRKPAKRRPFGGKWIAAVAAAAVILIIAASAWMYRDRAGERELPPIAASSQIERLVRLEPAAAGASRSYGVACVVDDGRSRQFVVYVFGAEATQGEQAYQVWLVKDGERRSGGTFRVGNEGIGLMTLPLAAADDPAFDTIGITLEPDNRGSAPRGPKVFGSG